ncbi:hypothetical protein MTO96_023402 [Rhipicephalus appendiculatus]
MSLRLPPYATSERHAVRGAARAAEESIVICVSEASEVEQEENGEAFIVSDASSDVLPDVLPTRVESPKDCWSRSCGETTLERRDVALAELTSMPFEHPKEPLEMPREPSMRTQRCGRDFLLQLEGETKVDVVCFQRCFPLASKLRRTAGHEAAGETTLEQGDVALAELTSMPSEQLKGTLEMPREPTVGPAPAALDVGEGRVEQSLGGYAVCLSEEERSWLKSGEHLHAPDTPATPVQPERWAVGESTASFMR